MVTETKIVPENMRYLLVKDHTFYELSKCGERYATAAVRPVGSECQFHIKFNNFNHKTFRQFIYDDWFTIRENVKHLGCRHIVGVFDDYDDGLKRKFCARLGAGEPKLLALFRMEA